jgi:hypothetical protein
MFLLALVCIPIASSAYRSETNHFNVRVFGYYISLIGRTMPLNASSPGSGALKLADRSSSDVESYGAEIEVEYFVGIPDELRCLDLALRETGWRSAATGVYRIDTDQDLKVWQGIQILAKQSASIGQIKTLKISLRAKDDSARKEALTEILQKPFPGPAPQ